MQRKNRSLPWSRSEYIRIEPGDLDPTPPTPERRIRVVAALATMMRDASMTDGDPGPANNESIRSLLTCDDVWIRDMDEIRTMLGRNHDLAYDPVDPRIRFEQIRKSFAF